MGNVPQRPDIVPRPDVHVVPSPLRNTQFRKSPTMIEVVHVHVYVTLPDTTVWSNVHV